MFELDFQKPCRVHMLGIGGISMSGLAGVLMNAGFALSGSDRSVSAITRKLEDKGAKIFYNQVAGNITDDIECVIYTAAIHPDNEEYAECVRRNIPMLSRAQLLGQIMKTYKNAIAVSGTHGKTSVTSMIAHILVEADTDPTISVGGMLPLIGGNFRIGGKNMFVTEACEYTNSFLEFFPTIGVILNIEPDHLDFFKDIDDIRNSFTKFAKLLPDDGCLVINNEIRDYKEIIGDFEGKVITFGNSEAYVSAKAIEYDENAFASFDLFIDGSFVDHISLGIPGEHNVKNALAAIAVALDLGIDESVFKRALRSYGGAKRRFEKKGSLGDITVFDDYAHHPQEIEATLKAAQHYPHNRIVCVFQPHLYSRTKLLLDEFGKALSLADVTVISDIYAARETNTLGISGKDVAEKINASGGHAVYVPTFGEIENFLLENLTSGDMCITMGAGDIVLVGERLLGE